MSAASEEIDDRGERIAALVSELEAHPGDASTATARELVALLLDVEGRAWSRLFGLVAAARDGPSIAELLRHDDVLAPVLALHGLDADAPSGTKVPAPPSIAVVPVSSIGNRSAGAARAAGDPIGAAVAD